MKTNAQFILSKQIVLQRFQEISKVANEVSYSFKTNRDVGYILRDNTNCSFSVHSPNAVDLLESPEKIWYFAQGWDDDEIKGVYDKGIRSFVVDNKNDLDLLLHFLGHINSKINLLLRLRLKEKTIHTGKHFVFGFFGQQINEMVPQLKNNPKISSLGIHFHRKTQNISEWDLRYELENVLEKETMYKIDCINIGGGVPTRYKNYSADVIESIFRKLIEFKNWLEEYDIKTIIEPGRFIAAPAVKLQTRIMNIYNGTIVVGCSVYNGAMDTFVTNIRLEVEGELTQEEGTPYTIKGKTPDSIDIFRYRVYLKNPNIGDNVVFLNAGAYTYSTDFCLLEPLPTIVVD